MKKYTIMLTTLLALYAVAMFALTLLPRAEQANASAAAGFQATVGTTSIAAVSATASAIFATSSCAARIITTTAQPIMLTFSDYAGQTPTGVFGHQQAASTTVVYDGGQYGCGLVKAYSFGSQTITVTETR